MAFTREKAAEIANKLGCESSVVLAVADVESDGAHDLPDGRPKILFEAHWFSKLTKGQFDAQYPGLSSPVWDRSLYKGGAAEWGRLNAAIRLDAEAALKSSSWGLFQIMGFNHKACGFDTVTAFVDFIKGPDDADMEAFINFVKANPLILKAMRAKDWKAFALHYNGPGAVASYSAKMADAYGKFAGQPDRAEEGPPLPVADPTLKPVPVSSSKTVIAGGVSVAAGAATVADQINQVTPIVESIATVGASFQNVLKLGALALSIVALVAVGYMLWRYIQKRRSGDVVSI
ncbi:MAG: N-acetylmuramidase family protein [Hyphomonadaceae bacterium]|nr:N-acetylmuramidase family protein [Hyphomonadaceae bacterium]